MPKENTLNLNSLKEELKSPILNLDSLKQEQEKKQDDTQVLKPSTPPQKKLKVDVNKLPSNKSAKNIFSLFKRKNFLIALSFIFITILGLFLLQNVYGKGGNFYIAKWAVELSDKEKLEGVQKFIYEFKDQKLSQSINLDSQGLKAKVELSANLKIKSSTHSKVTLQRSNNTVDSIQVQVPQLLCEQGGGCEEVKKKFESKFREEFEKNSKLDSDIVLTKVSADRLRLESSQEGDIILIRE
jgi:hypothetical protein